MCGYLPFRGVIGEIVAVAGEEEEEEGEDIFEREGAGDGRRAIEKAVEWLGEEIGVWGSGVEKYPMQSTPVFLGHGGEDEKVPVVIGRAAGEFLKDVDVEVVWKEYEGLGHWYSEDMLRDVVLFLKDLEGWTVSL